MADKRIKDLTNTATEADLVSGNYLALDGSAATKKLPANQIVGPSSLQQKKNSVYFVKIGSNTYRCVKVGNMLWMAENLREPIGTLNTDYFVAWNSAEDSEKYLLGNIYKWGCVCKSDGSMSDELAALIPSGSSWHVPTKDEGTALAVAIGGTGSGFKLYADSSLWTISTPTDEFGFRSLPTGYYNGSNVIKNQMSFFWTSTSASSANAYDFYFQANGTVNPADSSSKTNRAFSVRLCLALNPDGSIPSGNEVNEVRADSFPYRKLGTQFLVTVDGVKGYVPEDKVNYINEKNNVYGFDRGVFYQSTGKIYADKYCTAVIPLQAGFDYSVAVGATSSANAFHGTDWIYAEDAAGNITETNSPTISASSGYVRIFVNLRKTDGTDITVEEVNASYITLTKKGYVRQYVERLDSLKDEKTSVSRIELENRILKSELEVSLDMVRSAVGARVDSAAGEDTINLISSNGGKFIFNLHKRTQGDYGKYNDFYFPNARSDFGDVQFFDQDGKRLASKFIARQGFDIVPDTRLKIYKKVRGTSGGVVFGRNGDNLVSSSDNGVTWVNVSAFSGEKYTPIFVAADNSLLASSSNGNVYRSEAPYTSKTLVLDLYSVYGENLSTGPYQVDGDSSGNIYLGTYKTSYGNNKVYKSTDNGATWSVVLEENDYQHVHNVYVDKSQTPNAVYVGFDGGGQNNEYNGGIFKSTDGGSTWVDLRQAGLDIPQTTDHGVIFAASGYRLLGGESSTIDNSASIIRTENDSDFTVQMSNGKAIFSVVEKDGILFGCANSSGNFRSSEIVISEDSGKTWRSVMCSSYDGSNIEDGGFNTASVVGDEVWIYSNNSAAHENVNRRIIDGAFAEVLVDVPAGVTSVTAKCGYVLPDLVNLYNGTVDGDVFYAPLNENDVKNVVFVEGVKKVVDNDYGWTESDANRIGSIYPAIQSPVDKYAAIISGTPKNLYEITIPTIGVHISFWARYDRKKNGRIELISSSDYSIFISKSRFGYYDTSAHYVSYPITQTPLDTFQKFDFTIDYNGDCRCYVNGLYKSNGSGFDLSKFSGKVAFLSNDSADYNFAVQHFSVSSVIPTDEQILNSFYSGLNDNMSR